MQDILWLVLVFCTPLLVNFSGQQPFELPKALFVRALVWTLAALLAADYLRWRRNQRSALRAGPLRAAVLLLALVIGVTTITAVDWRLSLWGSYERSQGALTLLTYLLLCLLAAERWRSPAGARLLLQWLAAAAAPLLLISLLQLMGWRPMGLVSDARSPLFATLGRANFLAAYLAILAPLLLALLLASDRRGARALWGLLLLGSILLTGLTLSRSAWLALAAGLFFLALLWWGPRLRAHRRLAAWGLLGAIVMTAAAFSFYLTQGAAGGSLTARLLIWQRALLLIGHRPLLGYGADALPLVFPQVYPPELLYAQGRQFFVDRAHNLFLDWLLVAGLPGLLAYLLILILFFWNSLRALRRARSRLERALLAGIVAAVLAGLVNNLASFDVTPTATATWLLIGLGAGLSGNRAVGDGRPEMRRGRWRWAMAGLLLASTAVAIWQLNGRPLLADRAARTAAKALQAGALEQAVEAAGEAVAYWPAEPAHHLLLSRAYGAQAQADPATALSWLDEAEYSLDSARRLRPGDPLLWLHAGQFYSAGGEIFGRETQAKADAAFRQAAHLAPYQAGIYMAWGRAALSWGDLEKGAALLRQAVQLDASSGEAYLYLGTAELALGRREIALADYHEAVRLLPASAAAQAGLAQAYWRLGQVDAAERAAEAALHREPQNGRAKTLMEEMRHLPAGNREQQAGLGRASGQE